MMVPRWLCHHHLAIPTQDSIREVSAQRRFRMWDVDLSPEFSPALRWCDAPKEYGPAKTLYNR
jgi:hypothetical protein